MQDEVLDFINRRFNNPEVIKSFTNGNCYYFAQILRIRFNKGFIVYNEIDNHFGYLLDNKVYDITGIVCKNFKNDKLWQDWTFYAFTEPSNAKRIINDCIK
jgi:hypothetical protein